MSGTDTTEISLDVRALLSVNDLSGLLTESTDMTSIDFRSIPSCSLNLLAKEMLLGHLSCENVVGRKTVELSVRATVKLEAFSRIRYESVALGTLTHTGKSGHLRGVT